jgi:site-specific DNA-methyltransferase (adenine-specific)
MAKVPPELFTAVATDPPYALTDGGNGRGGFMGCKWDSDIPGVDTWRDVLRVSLPGAPLLSFGGTRTFHRLACAIEDAGWELRDTLCWLHAQGFPKSLSISKAIDKAAGAERVAVAPKVYADGTVGHVGLREDSGWKRPFMESDDWQGKMVTEPATPEANMWDGWGSALKPAHEPILLAMKPLAGTFVENALKHGVAGLWIDGARIEASDAPDMPAVSNNAGSRYVGRYNSGETSAPEPRTTSASSLGRWPANVILQHHADCVCVGTTRVKSSNAHFVKTTDGDKIGCIGANGLRRQPHGEYGHADADGMETVDDWRCVAECPVRMLDEQAGERPGCDVPSESRTSSRILSGIDQQGPIYGDRGGASRFYFCSKAGPSERAAFNNHPTVKPLDLMKWLLKLVTMPQRNLILDPFAGSGTTLVAARDLFLPCVGCEREERYAEIAAKRLEQAVLF